jgi:predicted nucleotidyltransferase
MTKNSEINRIKKIIVPILKKNDVVQAGIFGSYAHGKQRKKSDVDILIQYNKSKSLFDLVRLEAELENKLKKKVDLLTYKSIHPLIKERVLNEEVKIL